VGSTPARGTNLLIMRPYGRIKKIKASENWKKDVHPRPKKKWHNWWEEMNTIVPRCTMKQKWKKDI
jgi:hypothetical protein